MSNTQMQATNLLMLIDSSSIFLFGFLKTINWVFTKFSSLRSFIVSNPNTWICGCIAGLTVLGSWLKIS